VELENDDETLATHKWRHARNILQSRYERLKAQTPKSRDIQVEIVYIYYNPIFNKLIMNADGGEFSTANATNDAVNGSRHGRILEFQIVFKWGNFNY
jgi:hypothetical protein